MFYTDGRRFGVSDMPEVPDSCLAPSLRPCPLSLLTSQSHAGPLSQSDEQQPVGYTVAHADAHCRKGDPGPEEEGRPNLPDQAVPFPCVAASHGQLQGQIGT